MTQPSDSPMKTLPEIHHSDHQYSSSNYVEMLCKQSADLNKPNECGWTPLYRTIISGNNNATLELLQKGADPNLQCNMGETPLYQAVEMENIQQIETLLKNKANPNIALDDGTTPLHCAVLKRNADITRLLLENGAYPNPRTRFYLHTPLHLAVKSMPNEDIIKTLLAYTASTSLPDKDDKKPIDYAETLEIKTLLVEGEANQLVQISETSNTYHENTFTLDNRIDSFITKDNQSVKDIQSSQYIPNGSEEKRKERIDTIHSPNDKENNYDLVSANDNYNNEGRNENNNEANHEEECPYLNDSLEEDLSYTKSLSSSHKKKSEDADSLYKKIIIAKRLNFNNNKISYHKKNNTDTTPRNNSNEQREEHNNYNNHNISISNDQSSIIPNHNDNNLLETCIHNCSEQIINRTTTSNGNSNGINPCLNHTTDNDTNNNHKRPSGGTNIYSTFSTQPQSSNIASIKFQKKYYAEPQEQEPYGKVSEFTIKNVTPRQISSIQLSRMKKWLSSIDLLAHLNCFIDHEMCDIDLLLQSMTNNDTKIKYSDLENIGIKKPGHIYRILTKIELDSHLIEEKLQKFILPSSHARNNSLESKVNLKISEEYCCGCNFISRNSNKLDLFTFLRKKNLQHLQPNFSHNGFDWLEYVILQMFTDNKITEEILEDSLHIYNVEDRQKVLKCFDDETIKIKAFINTKDYIASPQRFKYTSLDLEEKEHERPCQACIIF